ncbi:MAG: hypothetical protein WDZ46_07765 [Solirubrobacterales bacterium]
MAHSPRSLLALALAATAALALVACGGEDAKLLPGETAREITANLDTVQQLSDEGDCVGAESAAQQVGEQIEAVEGVDPKLKRALEGGAARLQEVIAECEETSTEAIAPAEIPSEAEEDEGEERSRGGKDSDEKDDDEERAGKQSGPREDEGPDTPSTSPTPPPQAEGRGEGPPSGSAPPGEEEGTESPSGGVSPGSPAGGGE